jgi:CubicO group peptidase (beta-lactamase class C family)
MNPVNLALALGLLIGASLVAQAPPPTLPSDSEIRSILVDRIDKQHESVGIVVGVIDARGRRVVPHGSLAKGDTRPLNGDTVFEIGSITKMFTALLLTDMVQRGDVALGDPVAKYLPPDVTMPQRGGRQITLQDLATHTSGLPRLPSNLASKDPSNPYVDYSIAQLYQFLSGYQLTRDIDSQFDYSNLGFGLLGPHSNDEPATTTKPLPVLTSSCPLACSTPPSR